MGGGGGGGGVEGLLVMWLYYSGRLTMMGQFSVGVATFFRGLVEGGHCAVI